jgi:hypothetical protein
LLQTLVAQQAHAFTEKEPTVYIGMGTIVLILVIVIFFMMMRRSRA